MPNLHTNSRCWIGRLAIAAALVGLIVRSVLADSVPKQAGDTSSTSPIKQILDAMNRYRSQEHLDPLTESQSDSRGAANHARYIIENKLGPGDFAIDAGQVKSAMSSTVHNEAIGNQWYSVAGASVASKSDIFTAAAIPADVGPVIDRLMTSPLSALIVLEPTLISLGYGGYCADGRCAGVIVYNYYQSPFQLPHEFKQTAANPRPYIDENYGSGDNGRIYLKSPIQFPPDGGSFPLGSYDGGREFDNPLSPCAGYQAPTGLPLVLSLGRGLNDSAALKLESYSVTEGEQPLESCGYDAYSYTNQNSQVQETGRNILRWKLSAVVIPRAPLKPGHTYTVSMTADSTEYKWSFKIQPTSP